MGETTKFVGVKVHKLDSGETVVVKVYRSSNRGRRPLMPKLRGKQTRDLDLVGAWKKK